MQSERSEGAQKVRQGEKEKEREKEKGVLLYIAFAPYKKPRMRWGKVSRRFEFLEDIQYA